MAEQTTQVLGIVGMTNKGDYNSGTYYEKLNVVSYNGSSYCAKTSAHGILPTDSDYWQLIASKGDKGDTGDTGPSGYTPVKGVDYYTSSDINDLERTLDEDVSAEVTEQLGDLVSASPLAASSVSDMVDTTRIYVNTTDGYWYYYDGDSWEQGGVYQATALNTDSVRFNNLDGNLISKLFGKSTDVSNLGNIWYGTGSTSWNFTNPIYIKKGTTIQVSNDFVSNYVWNIRRMTGPRSFTGLFSMTSDTSYQFTDDELCVFAWQPIDGDWETETYTVNRRHLLNSNDITNIEYYYPIIENGQLVDLNEPLITSLNAFCGGSLSNIRYSSSATRIGIARPIISKYPIRFDVKNGYDYGIITWTSNADDRVGIEDTGWINESIIIPANTYFSYTYRKHDDSNLTFNDLKDVIYLTSYSDFTYTKTLIDNLGNANYYYNGEKLNTRNKYGFNISTLYAFDNKMTGGSSQGFTIYGNYIVQLYDHVGIQLRNFSTGEVISNISLSSIGHGDTCQFSNTFYDNSDLFPLLYVTADDTPATIRVIRISNTTTATLVEKLNLGENGGYYGGQSFDFDNGLIYNFAYKNQNFRNNSNGNEMIISVYNMNNKTLISGNEYSVELLDRYTKPFIYCIQGQKFYNGKCVLVSSYLPSEQKTKIYVYDPIYKRISSIFEDFSNTILNTEVEDIDFVMDNDTKNYYLVIGSRYYYYKCEFVD